MDISIFLAKVLGLYLLIISFAMLIHADKFRRMIPDMDTPIFRFFGGVMALMMGLLIVVSHNVWEMDWRVLITIIGWLALLKGVMRLIFLGFANTLIEIYSKNKKVYLVTVLILFLIGLYLSYEGFAAVSIS